MDNTYIALKKILNIMVPEKYPMVSDIKVIDDSYEYNNTEKYIIYLGISYNSFTGIIGCTISIFHVFLNNHISQYIMDNKRFSFEISIFHADLRDYVREVSRYVLKGDESLKIFFSDSDLY
jgi:hypothetical protein